MYFCRVVIQNERYEDWTSTIIQLKTLFKGYHQHVLQYHHHPDCQVPTGHNSTAAEGNILEVLNMALNSELLQQIMESRYIEDITNLTLTSK